MAEKREIQRGMSVSVMMSAQLLIFSASKCSSTEIHAVGRSGLFCRLAHQTTGTRRPGEFTGDRHEQYVFMWVWHRIRANYYGHIIYSRRPVFLPGITLYFIWNSCGSDLTMSKFILEIELGNDAMRSGYDIAEALGRVSTRIYNTGLNPTKPSIGDVRDINGNVVGKYEVVPE
jgi:hypothetical protein